MCPARPVRRVKAWLQGETFTRLTSVTQTIYTLFIKYAHMMRFTYAWLTCTTTPWVPLHVPLTLALVGLAAALSLAPVSVCCVGERVAFTCQVQERVACSTCKDISHMQIYMHIQQKMHLRIHYIIYIYIYTYLPNNDVNRLRRHSNSGTRNAVATPPGQPVSFMGAADVSCKTSESILSYIHIYIYIFIYQAPRILNTSSS